MIYEKAKGEFGYVLKKKEAAKLLSIQIEKKVSYDDLESILVGAIEGAINYWGGIKVNTPIWEQKPSAMPVSQYALQILIDDWTLQFFENMEEVDESDSDWTLTLDKLLHGIKLNIQERAFDSNLEDSDATTYDCIIQYALFGEIIYG